MEMTSWGRFPRIDAVGHAPRNEAALRACVLAGGEKIAHGMGRSYGDSALNREVILTGGFRYFLDFDTKTGIITCEAGVSLSDIIDVVLPRGWFLPVTPGTRFVSLGGAIASDVHGKNHHLSGSFCDHVIGFDLMMADGAVVRCSRSENEDLFHATCGGMGLTGVILRGSFRLQKVRSCLIRQEIFKAANLSEVIDLFEEKSAWSYSVAWIDCLATGTKLGRSLLMVGEHADEGTLFRSPAKTLSVPFDFPRFCLNRYSVSAFNHLYHRRKGASKGEQAVSLEHFFFPLDSILNWNRIYGAGGFTQYQFVLPKASGAEGLRTILARIARSGRGSFLAVLKLFGKGNENLLSFPMEGFSLALDFKIEPGLFPLLDELDHIVMDHGGRLYLAKDARMRAGVFRRGYPKWEVFRGIRETYGLAGRFDSLQARRLEV